MALHISPELLNQINTHGESAYPEEGAGLLLGSVKGEERTVVDLLGFENAREQAARHNRYLITPQDMLWGEQEAVRRGLDILGVFHSHPDHPSRPSEFDREWALPWYSYVITSVYDGRATASSAWRLTEDRSGFEKEEIIVNQISGGNMSLFFVRHQHSPETCPAKDPAAGAMLLTHLSPQNAKKFGVNIQGDAVLDGQHTFVLIMEAASPDQIETFMQPFKQAGEVEIFPASPCETVVERAGC